MLEEALGPFEGGPPAVHGAGRTDAGVHALGQVASVRARTQHSVATLHRALNAVLPSDVRVVSVEDAPPAFHARFDAVAKTYEYRIANAPFVSPFEYRYVWHVPGALDVAAMRRGAEALLGRHDFAAFQSTGGDVHTTERTILSLAVGSERGQSGVRPGSDQGQTPLVIRVTGDGFLRHMVRSIAGTLVDVGPGALAGEPGGRDPRGRDRTRAGRCAPAAGLCLVRVDYGR